MSVILYKCEIISVQLQSISIHTYNITNMETQKSKKELVAEMRKQLSELDPFLGYGYVKKVKEKLGYKVKNGTIHSVKCGNRDTIAILSAILSVAKEIRDDAKNTIEQ